MIKGVKEVLVTEEQIKEKVAELGKRISEDYKDKVPVVLGVLKGSFIFMADLVRHMTIPCEVDFMSASSYGARTVTSGVLNIKQDVTLNLEGRDIIIAEDILDSGITLSGVLKHLEKKKVKSVSICVLLDKPERRHPDININPEYVAFNIPDEFVIGYGLDYDEKYRNLPFIGVYDQETEQ